MWGTKKYLTSKEKSNPKRSVFAIWRFTIELQKIMNSFCTCLTRGDGAASTLTYIRKTQDKKIFIPRKAMVSGISERYCGRNCYCSEGFYARNQNGFLHETLHQKLSLPWLVVSCKCKIRKWERKQCVCCYKILSKTNLDELKSS